MTFVTYNTRHYGITYNNITYSLMFVPLPPP